MGERNVTRFPCADSRNSLCDWWKAKGPLNVFWNFWLIELAKYSPSLALKRAMYRLTGMKVGRDASVGAGAMFDFFFPELIEVGENCVIGYGSLILAHEFLVEEYRTGKVVIGKDAMIGANCTVLPGVKIGDGAKVSAMSLVNCDVPKGAFYGGIPARKLVRGKA